MSMSATENVRLAFASANTASMSEPGREERVQLLRPGVSAISPENKNMDQGSLPPRPN